jgi:hypothetical protein
MGLSAASWNPSGGLKNLDKYRKIIRFRGGEEFMKKTIGEMAGKVWKTLGKKGRAEISKLPQIMKQKEEFVYLALGWLAKEDKIDFHKKEGKTLLSLTIKEQEIFKKVH